MEEYISVPVPRSRVQEVYQLLATPPASGAAQGGGGPPAPGGRRWDRALLERAYRESPEAMKRVFDHLADNASRAVTIEDLARAINRRRPQLAGVLGAFGRRWKNRYRNPGDWPFKPMWSNEKNMWTYTMEAAEAEVIIALRK